MTLVSIVTPSLNQARYLREAIESVRTQTYAPIEHIVVDGGSTDGSLDILAECGDVRWSSEPDRGQSHALNKGFGQAQGDVLGWLNADDAYEPHAVSEAIAALADAGLAYADVMRVNDDGVDPRRIRSRPQFNLWTELNLGGGIYSPAVFFTRAAFETVGPLDDFWPERLSVSRRHGGRLVSPLLITRYVHGTRAQRFAIRAAGAAYALMGKPAR